MGEIKTKAAETERLAFRRGWIVLIVLAMLTAVEITIAIRLQSITILFVIILIKAAIIVQNFMHVSEVFASEEAAH